MATTLAPPTDQQAEVCGNNVLVPVDAGKLHRLTERLRQRQSLPLAILAGVATGAAMAFLWGAIVGITGLTYEVDWVPLIGIGFLVGTVVRFVGRGVDRSFAIAAAVIAFLAGLAGSLFSMSVALTWQLHNVPNFYLFQYGGPATWARLFFASVGWIDVACLEFTTWEAYMLARYRLPASALATLAPRGALP
jgi:hypothetical protein